MYTIAEKKETFKRLYADRTSRQSLKGLLVKAVIKKEDFDIWLEDKYFLEDLIDIDRRKAFLVREYFHRHLIPIAENLVSIASTGANSNAVSAARMIFEIANFLEPKQGAKQAQINIQTNVVAARDQSDKELLEEHGRLRSLLRTAERVHVEDEGSGSGTDSTLDSAVGSD